MVDKLKEIISKYGENDGTTCRHSLKHLVHRDGFVCFAIAIDNTNELVTFWEDKENKLTNILCFTEMHKDIQKRIYKDIKKQYPYEFTTDYWNEYRALKDRCANDVISIVRELGGKVILEDNNQPIVGYYNIDGEMSNVLIEGVSVTDKNVLLVDINDGDNGRTVTLKFLQELAIITIYEKLLVARKDFFNSINKYGRKWTKCTDFQPSDEDWIVMVTDEGTLYMNSLKRTMHFVENDGTILTTDI